MNGLFRFRIICLVIIICTCFTACIKIGPASDTVLTIIHTNDVHARVKEGKYDGMGYAKLFSYIKKMREEHDNLLLLDAGDTLHGTTFASLTKGESIVSLLNSIGYSAMVPGNHDFNYGYKRLIDLAAKADFPVLAANVFDENDSAVFKQYIIINKNGLKIGIFGLVTPETYYKTHPKNVEGLVIKDPVESAEEMVKALRNRCHVLIALAHIGIDNDTEIKSTDIAEKVEGIDIIVDGHSHSVLENGINAGSTLIVQAGSHLESAGVVTVEYKNGKVESKSSFLFSKEDSGKIIEDPGIAEQIAGIEEENNKITEQVVGVVNVLLNGERSDVRTMQTNLGTAVCKAMLERTSADICLMNGGGIRASIKPGEVTLGDVITVLPFGNTVVLLEVTGDAIKLALENGLSSYPSPSGAFPQTAGVVYTFNKNAEPGSRVSDIKINGMLLEPGKKYKLVTNDFIAAGGDNYKMFKEQAKKIGEFGTLDEIFIGYFQSL